MALDRYTWEAPRVKDSYTHVLDAYAEDGTRIAFHVAAADNEVTCSFVVFIEDDYRNAYSSDDTQDWDTVERYVPRGEWPAEMNAGKKAPLVRRPDEAILREIEAAREDIYTTADGDVADVEPWLGDFADNLDDEAKKGLAEAFARLEAMYPEDDMTRDDLYNVAASIFFGDSTLEEFAREEARTAYAAELARRATQAAIVACYVKGDDITDIAKRTGLSRKTVYKRLGMLTKGVE